MPARVVVREEDGVRRHGGGLAEIAVQRLHECHPRRAVHGEVRVQDVRVLRYERGEVEARIAQPLGRQLHQGARFGDVGTGLRDQGHAVAQRREAADQRDHDALRAAVSLDGQPVMARNRDVHGGHSISRRLLRREASR